MVRAIKVIQLKQYNQQYIQSHQKNTIKAIQSIIGSVIQSKQYDQQYNQDKPKGNNGYIVNSTHAKGKDLSKSLILGGCRKINSRAIPYNI